MPQTALHPSPRIGSASRIGAFPGARTSSIPGREALPMAMVVLIGVLLGAATTVPVLVPVAVACGVLAFIASIALRAPRQAVIGVILWLALLGMLRRMMLLGGAPGSNDALLLVAPAMVGLLASVATRRGAFRSRTRLANAVLALMVLAAIGVLNPLQGSLAVGLSGLLFVMVPLLWFWVGRSVVDDRLLHRLVQVIAVVAPIGAAYGLYQVYRGLPPWDANWIEASGYTSLQVSGSLRQFASFSAASEYVIFIAIGTLIWVLRARRTPRLAVAVPTIAVLAWALVLVSARGAVVGLVVSLGIVFAVARGFGIGRTLLVGLGALAVLGLAVSRLDPTAVGGPSTSALLSRQVTGLSAPFDPEVSTLPVHIDAAIEGLRQMVANPLGRGTGAVSIAADRFGEGSQTTEFDPTNAAVAFGLPGLVAFGAVFFLGLRRALRQARRRRDLISLAALGILLLTSLGWLNGGNYAVAPLPWLVLGWLDRPDVPETAATREVEAVAIER